MRRLSRFRDLLCGRSFPLLGPASLHSFCDAFAPFRREIPFLAGYSLSPCRSLAASAPVQQRPCFLQLGNFAINLRQNL